VKVLAWDKDDTASGARSDSLGVALGTAPETRQAELKEKEALSWMKLPQDDYGAARTRTAAGLERKGDNALSDAIIYGIRIVK
jgi:hypothetical protein